MNETQQKLMNIMGVLEKMGIWMEEITVDKKCLKELKETNPGMENSYISYKQLKKRGKIMNIFVNELKKEKK